jgi:hypothetical protein
MDLLMTRTAKAHEVALIICPSLGERNDVVDFLDWFVATLL